MFCLYDIYCHCSCWWSYWWFCCSLIDNILSLLRGNSQHVSTRCVIIAYLLNLVTNSMTKAPNRHPLKWWWGDACLLLINLPNNCTTLPNSWNIAVSSVKCFGAFGALPHWGCGWVYYACIHVLVLISYCVEFLWSWAELFLCENEICFKIWVLGILTPRAGRPPEYFDWLSYVTISNWVALATTAGVYVSRVRKFSRYLRPAPLN